LLPIVDGVVASGGSGSAIPFDSGEIVTTDATVQRYQIANFPAIGDGVSWYVHIHGVETNGDRVGFVITWGGANRNSVGTGGQQLGAIGPGGTTDVGVNPWTGAGALPAGWGVSTMDIVGNTAGVLFNGAVGNTVRWRVFGLRGFFGTATP
jgi:hypothetical protein